MSHFKTKPSLLCYGPFVDWVNTVIDASTVEGRFGSKVGRIWVEVGCFGLNSSPNQLYFPQSFSHWGEFKLAGCKGEGWMGASHPIISKVKHQHFLSQPPSPSLETAQCRGSNREIYTLEQHLFGFADSDFNDCFHCSVVFVYLHVAIIAV